MLALATHRNLSPARRGALAGAAILLAILGLPGEAQAQSDAELWMEVGLRAKLSKSLRLTVSESLRLEDDFTSWSGALTDVALSLRLNKTFTIGAAYRLGIVPDKDGITRFRHRFHAQAAAGVPIGPTRVSLRLRFQEQLRAEADSGATTRHIVRTRLKLTVPLSELKLFTTATSFHRLAHRDLLAYLDAIRFSVGVSTKLLGPPVTASYRVEQSTSDEDDPTRHIFGLEVRFGL